MNQLKLVLFSLALVILAACGGKSDSDSTDAEFLKVSAELKQTLPQINESLSSQSPEGIWRIASHSVFNSNYDLDNEETSGFLDMEFKSYNQLLIIIKKDDSAENAYVVFKCDGYRGTKSWGLNGDTLSYETISNRDIYSSKDGGYLVLDNNLSLGGKSSYQYNDSKSDQQENKIYTGVKISDATDFREAQDLNISLQINEKGAFYQLSDYLLNPSCFSISQSEGQLKEYTPATKINNSYNLSSSSFVIEMKNGDRVSAYEEVIVIDAETSVVNASYNSDINIQNIQLYDCSIEMEAQDDNCLDFFAISTNTQASAMSASGKADSLIGEVFEIYFSYSQE